MRRALQDHRESKVVYPAVKEASAVTTLLALVYAGIGFMLWLSVAKEELRDDRSLENIATGAIMLVVCAIGWLPLSLFALLARRKKD